jgi:hypothetical protein
VFLVALVFTPAFTGAYSPDPVGVPTDFICAYREYAAEYAARLRPDYDQKIVFDALMLGSLCNKTYSDIARPELRLDSAIVQETQDADSTIYVAVNGDDKNPGTQDKPMKTVGAGLVASRKLAGPKTLSIGPGTYFLTSTLLLTDKDENLLIASTGQVWLSGAKPLPAALKWEEYKVSPATPGSLSSHNNTNVQHGCKANDISDPNGCQCYNITSYGASVQQCFDYCKSLGQEGCQSYGWSPGPKQLSGEEQQGWSNNCCIRRTDKSWSPGTGSSDQGHVSGHWEGGSPAKNIWKTVLPADADLSTIPQLRVGDSSSSGYRRSPRAR